MRRNTDWRLEQWRSEGLLHQTETGRLYKLWRTCKESWKSSSITLSPAEHQTEGSCWRLQIREDRDNKQGLFVLLHTLTSDLYLFCLLLIIFPMQTIWVRVQSFFFSGWFAHAQRACANQTWAVWFSQSEQRKYLHLWDLASLKPRLKSSYKHP